MACEYCEIIERKKNAAKLYEDSKVVAFLAPQPATIGHVIVAPKKHSPIFEAADDAEVKHAFKVANKISIAVFEAIKCEGTNIIVNNGIEAGQEVPHFCIHIIARKSGDGLSFDWPTKQLKEEEMATVELQLKEAIESPAEEALPTEDKGEATGPGEGGEEEKDKEGGASGDEPGEPEDVPDDENYLTKQLRRIP